VSYSEKHFYLVFRPSETSTKTDIPDLILQSNAMALHHMIKGGFSFESILTIKDSAWSAERMLEEMFAAREVGLKPVEERETA
jgi:hypothetical protein